MQRLIKKYIGLFIFGIAMGLMEAIIVVYLRELYYPEGFGFPLHGMPDQMVLFEWIREVCTIVMLISLAWLSGKTRIERFAFFIYSFAIWDIFYYIGLKGFLNWPESLFTWDILFLIPVPWLSPVLVPVLCSVGMIALAIQWTWLQQTHHLIRIKWKERSLLISGTVLIFWTFIQDSVRLLQTHGQSGISDLKSAIALFVPESYNWMVFGFGTVLIVTSTILIQIRATKGRNRVG